MKSEIQMHCSPHTKFWFQTSQTRDVNKWFCGRCRMHLILTITQMKTNKKVKLTHLLNLLDEFSCNEVSCAESPSSHALNVYAVKFHKLKLNFHTMNFHIWYQLKLFPCVDFHVMSFHVIYYNNNKYYIFRCIEFSMNNFHVQIFM